MMDLIIVAAVALTVGLANCIGNEYPAGLDPKSCPNYPNCDNALLHGSSVQAEQSQWNSAIPTQNDWDNSWESYAGDNWNAPAAAPAVSVPGTQYPAGVDPRSCPNYPNCDNVVLHGSRDFTAHANSAGSWRSEAPGSSATWNTAPADGHPQGQIATQYPAGVSAQSCPNYPYC